MNAAAAWNAGAWNAYLAARAEARAEAEAYEAARIAAAAAMIFSGPSKGPHASREDAWQTYLDALGGTAAANDYDAANTAWRVYHAALIVADGNVAATTYPAALNAAYHARAIAAAVYGDAARREQRALRKTRRDPR